MRAVTIRLITSTPFRVIENFQSHEKRTAPYQIVDGKTRSGNSDEKTICIAFVRERERERESKNEEQTNREIKIAGQKSNQCK